MTTVINRISSMFRSLFLKKDIELALVGLQRSGKTTFANFITSGQFSQEHIQTIGLVRRQIKTDNATIKMWDISGQPRFRQMWERYSRGVNAIVYMVDAADKEELETSRDELHNLLDRPELVGIPVLVLGNKSDLPGALGENELRDRLNLSAIQGRKICCYSVSCKSKSDIDMTLIWLYNLRG